MSWRRKQHVPPKRRWIPGYMVLQLRMTVVFILTYVTISTVKTSVQWDSKGLLSLLQELQDLNKFPSTCLMCLRLKIQIWNSRNRWIRSTHFQSRTNYKIYPFSPLFSVASSPSAHSPLRLWSGSFFSSVYFPWKMEEDLWYHHAVCVFVYPSY
jgi:hypothetical protein